MSTFVKAAGLVLALILPANATTPIPQTGTIKRPAGTKLAYHFLRPAPPHPSFPILLYLDGSSCRSVKPVLPFFTPFLSEGFGALTFEKRGVNPGDSGDICGSEFLDTNERRQRVEDAKLLIAAAKTLFPGWDGRLVVVGASEGGTIAPEVASLYPQTVALVSLAGGGWSQSQELKALKERELASAGATPAVVSEELKKLDSQFEDIRRDPTSARTWLGADNTYKRWASYLWYSPLDFFEKLDIPVFVAQGTADTAAPIGSSDAIRDRFQSLGKTNLTYHRYDGLDHGWNDSSGNSHVDLVIGDLAAYLTKFASAPVR